jgi:hypothetical protein
MVDASLASGHGQSVKAFLRGSLASIAVGWCVTSACSSDRVFNHDQGAAGEDEAGAGGDGGTSAGRGGSSPRGGDAGETGGEAGATAATGGEADAGGARNEAGRGGRGGSNPSSAGAGGADARGGSSGESGSAGSNAGAAGEGDAAAGASGSGNEPRPDCTDCTPIVLRSLHDVAALAVRSPLLYYVENTDEAPPAAQATTLRSMSVNGGTPSALTLGPAPDGTHQLVVDAAYVYAAEYTISRVPLTGDTTFQVLDGAPNYYPLLRINDTAVFARWALTGTHITRIPKDGSDPVTVITNNLNDWVGYDVDADTIFTATKTVVSSVSALGGTPVIVATSDADEELTEVVAAGATRLALASNTRVATVPKSGGTPETRADGPAYGLVSDGSHLFYFRPVSGGGDTCANGSELYAVPIGGGREQHLATEPGSCVSNVVNDASAVYWVPGDRASIHKAKKMP